MQRGNVKEVSTVSLMIFACKNDGARPTCREARLILHQCLPDAKCTFRSHVANHNLYSRRASAKATITLLDAFITYNTGCLYHRSDASLFVGSTSNSRSSPKLKEWKCCGLFSGTGCALAYSNGCCSCSDCSSILLAPLPAVTRQACNQSKVESPAESQEQQGSWTSQTGRGRGAILLYIHQQVRRLHIESTNESPCA